MGTHSAVRVGNRTLRVSNLEKVLFPQTGWTKAHVLDYYTRVAPVLLPHLRGRALTLKRYPEGVGGPHFYEKECPSHRPDWIQTQPMWSDAKNRDINFCVINDLAALAWSVNLANIELHVLLSRSNVERPTALAFDLDPGPPADLVSCAQVAVLLRDLLRTAGLESFPKTSGRKGMQLFVPLNRPYTYESTKPFARAVAEAVEAVRPREVTSKMKKDLRPGKVFIDWSQNDQHKSTVCAYSLRAVEPPGVSTPLEWAEVEEAIAARDPDLLRFTPDEVLDRVAEKGDLFAPLLDLKQRLPEISKLAS